VNKSVTLKYALIVALFAASSSLILSFTYQFTQPSIQNNKKRAEDNAIKLVAPDGAKTYETFEQEDGYKYIAAYDEDKQKIGYIIKVNSKGYSSVIQMLVGLDPELNITGVKILSQTETPGLGTRIDEKGFINQFVRKKGDDIYVDKDGGEISSITGATISSRAVTNGLREEIKKFKEVHDKK